MDDSTTRRWFMTALTAGVGSVPSASLAFDAAGRGSLTGAGTVPAGSGAELAGQDGSALVAFTQAGRGGVGRSAQDKLRELSLSVMDFGSAGDDATDNTRSLLAAIAAAGVAGRGYLDFPAGIFRCSTAVTLPAGLILRGSGKRRTFLKFTGATDGVVVSDAFANVGICDLTIQTSNPRAGAALKFTNKASGASNSIVENVDIGIENDVTGRWDYGIWAINWQNSRVSGVRIAYGCDVGIHLEYGCNATTWNAIEIVGYNGSTRGIEMFGYDTSTATSHDAARPANRNTFDSYWYGLTVQGGFSASCIYVDGASPKIFGCHPENTDAIPSDGADVVIAGGGISNASLAGVAGGSLLTTGTVRNLTVAQSELNTITIGPDTQGGQFGVRFASLTDNSGGTWDVITSALGTGNRYPSVLNDALITNKPVTVAVTGATVRLPPTPTGTITLTAPRARTVTTLSGGRDGQTLLLSFGDTNTTLKGGAGNLRIGTDFTPSNSNSRIYLERQGANWFQISRASN